MKELYVEGLANHNDHESCTGNRKDTREALIVAHIGWEIEPRKSDYRTPTRSQAEEGNTAIVDNARRKQVLRGLRPQHVWKL